jgi:hypothetical protein
MDRTLRWMCENLEGAYTAKYPAGHTKAGKHCTNSGTCVLVCCYIEALGKVLLKGKGGNRERFSEFLGSSPKSVMVAGGRRSSGRCSRCRSR